MPKPISREELARRLLLKGVKVGDVSGRVGLSYPIVRDIYLTLKGTDDHAREPKKATAKVTRAKAPTPSEPTPDVPGSRGRTVRDDAGIEPDPITSTGRQHADNPPSNWSLRPDDEDAGPCAECGYGLINRTISYGGRDYGRALIHTFRGVPPTAAQIATIERHRAKPVVLAPARRVRKAAPVSLAEQARTAATEKRMGKRLPRVWRGPRPS